MSLGVRARSLALLTGIVVGFITALAKWRPGGDTSEVGWCRIPSWAIPGINTRGCGMTVKAWSSEWAPSTETYGLRGDAGNRGNVMRGSSNVLALAFAPAHVSTMQVKISHRVGKVKMGEDSHASDTVTNASVTRCVFGDTGYAPCFSGRDCV